jgi:hypothetical protein
VQQSRHRVTTKPAALQLLHPGIVLAVPEVRCSQIAMEQLGSPKHGCCSVKSSVVERTIVWMYTVSMEQVMHGFSQHRQRDRAKSRRTYWKDSSCRTMNDRAKPRRTYWKGSRCRTMNVACKQHTSNVKVDEFALFLCNKHGSQGRRGISRGD